MSRLLNRLGNTAAHKRWFVIGAWVIAIVLATTAVKTLGANTSNNLELPGTDSQAASDLLAAKFPPQQNGANPIVFRTSSGKVTDEANKKAIDEAHKAILAMPHAWWLPKWAGRFLAHIDIEGEGSAKKDSLDPMKL